MKIVYTDIWNGFQFRPPTYLDGHFEPHKFDLVKWYDHEPYEVFDLETGKKRMSTRSCMSVAFLEWDTREQSFQFKSVGLRFLECYVDGLNEFIMDFCKAMEKQFVKAEDNYFY